LAVQLLLALKLENACRVQLLAELRLLTESPLVLIAEGFETARSDLESGADQRLPKPFIPGALVGAIHAALRKSTSAFLPPSSHVETHGMVLDGDQRSLTFANAGHDALVDHNVFAHHQLVVDPAIDHSDHDGLLDSDHRTRAAAGHRNLDAATSSAPLVAKQYAGVTAHAAALLSR